MNSDKKQQLSIVLNDLYSKLGIKNLKLIAVDENTYILNNKYKVIINCSFIDIFKKSIYKNYRLKYRLIKK